MLENQQFNIISDMKKKRDKSKTSIFREIVIPAELNCNDAVIQKEFNNLQLADCFEKQQEIVLSVSILLLNFTKFCKFYNIFTHIIAACRIFR